MDLSKAQRQVFEMLRSQARFFTTKEIDYALFSKRSRGRASKVCKTLVALGLIEKMDGKYQYRYIG